MALSGSVGSQAYSKTATLTFSRSSGTQTTVSASKTFTLASNNTITYQKGTSAQSRTISFSVTNGFISKTSSGVTGAISVPALTKHTVSYNANTGSGSIAAQTKYYGTDINLASSGFSKTGYRLTGWNTAANGSGQAYALGAKYTVNSTTNITLYAQWQFIYVKPSITNAKVFRVDSTSSSTETDTGTCIRVQFDWQGGTANGSSYITPTCVITIDGTATTETLSGTSGSFDKAYGNSYSENIAHQISVKLSDTNDSTGTSISLSVGTPVYPIDVLANGSAMGIMMPAQEGHKLSVPELCINLDSTADSALITAITALGWQSDVII